MHRLYELDNDDEFILPALCDLLRLWAPHLTTLKIESPISPNSPHIGALLDAINGLRVLAQLDLPASLTASQHVVDRLLSGALTRVEHLAVQNSGTIFSRLPRQFAPNWTRLCFELGSPLAAPGAPVPQFASNITHLALDIHYNPNRRQQPALMRNPIQQLRLICDTFSSLQVLRLLDSRSILVSTKSTFSI